MTAAHTALAFATHPGKVREKNEDAYVCLTPEQTDGFGHLLVVADGMGGAQAGELASYMLVNAFNTQYGTLRRAGAGARTAIAEIVARANDTMVDLCEARPELRGMGTTCAVVAIENGALFRVPIEAMLETMEVRALAPLVRTDGTLDFLVATEVGLFNIVGDQASPIRVDGAPLVVSRLAARPRVGDVLSAWAVEEGGLVRITLGEGPDDPPLLARMPRLGEIEALASDDEGRPWWVEDGVLFSMTRDQRVIVRPLPMPAGVAPSAITAIAAERELWIHGADAQSGAPGALFHFDGHVFRAITGGIEGMTIRCATGSECLGFDGRGEMARIAVRHAAGLEGLAEAPRCASPSP